MQCDITRVITYMQHICLHPTLQRPGLAGRGLRASALPAGVGEEVRWASIGTCEGGGDDGPGVRCPALRQEQRVSSGQGEGSAPFLPTRPPHPRRKRPPLALSSQRPASFGGPKRWGEEGEEGRAGPPGPRQGLSVEKRSASVVNGGVYTQWRSR